MNVDDTQPFEWTRHGANGVSKHARETEDEDEAQDLERGRARVPRRLGRAVQRRPTPAASPLPRGRRRPGPPRRRRPGVVGPAYPVWPAWIDDSDEPGGAAADDGARDDDDQPGVAGNDDGDGAGPEPEIGRAPAHRPGRPRMHIPLPRAGSGYYSYRPSNIQYGHPRAIAAVRVLGRLWARAFPGEPRLGVGAISLRLGRRLHRHGGHALGLDVDLRPLRNDRRELPVHSGDSAYCRARTQRLVDLLRRGSVLPVVRIAFADRRLRGVDPTPAHVDHLHVTFAVPGGRSTR